MVKILYLEDEATIQEVTAEYLHLQGYEVTLAQDGGQAQKLIATQHFDLMIFDIMIPTINGLDLLAQTKQAGISTPIIMLSALGDEASQLSAFDCFADDYIIKPFSPVLLIKRIEAILRRITHQTNSSPGLIIDEGAYQAFYNGTSMCLTYTEYLIFHALADNPNLVFTRAQLLEIIAPDDFLISDRVIDAHIKNIRKKCPVPLVRTITGLGYQFESAL